MAAAFKAVGPFSLRRSDQLVTALLISFKLGAPRTTAVSWLIASALLLAAALFASFASSMVAALIIVLLLWIFVGVPLMRPLKYARNIMVDLDDDGIVVETPVARTVYKWAALGRTRLFQRRLFVMITDRAALVVPERVTSRENLQVAQKLIEDRLSRTA